jgi:hypothetical protein
MQFENSYRDILMPTVKGSVFEVGQQCVNRVCAAGCAGISPDPL